MKPLLPALTAALGWMALAGYAAPRISGSPVACLMTHPSCDTNTQMAWIAVLFLIVPFLILNVLGTEKKRARS